jgi:hypothetical protein
MISPNGQNKSPNIDQLVTCMREFTDEEFLKAVLRKFNELQENTEKKFNTSTEILKRKMEAI